MPSPFSSPRHFNIVALETFFTPLPALTIASPHTFTLTQYSRSTLDEVRSRIKDADILITTTVPLRAEALSPHVSPNLKLIAVMASGTDSIDLEACATRGIRVLNSPGCNADAVAEHAVALYFTIRRAILPAMRDLKAGEWPRRGTLMTSAYTAGRPPRACRDETVAVIGYGDVGQRVAKLVGGLGMKVLIAGRKQATTVLEGRINFEEALRTATVFVVCCPRNSETRDLLSAPEFAMMQDDAVLINVARGDVVNEAALLEALKKGQIAGAGVDVFGCEPASEETSPLLTNDCESLNLVVTPHTAWIGGETTANYQTVLQENINGFILGKVNEERIKA